MTPFTLTREQVRDLDRRAAAEYDVSGLVLMENAGRGCAELLMRLNPDRRPTAVLCGPGNNGGDGFVLARHLDNHGWPVEVFYLSPKSEDAQVNLRPLLAAGVSLLPLDTLGMRGLKRLADSVLSSDRPWVVDALFGTGLSRPLHRVRSQQPLMSFEDVPAEVVSVVNASGRPVLAIDLPSGLDADTGDPLGPCVRATHTATFVAPKRGFLNPASRAWTGAVHVIDIGAPRRLIDRYRTA